ncbi:hypothetical protein PIB30_044588 [Stylosanthes scabra]|uniref:BURP domain-containing protein n=1 Tax=Stylosanthes scabra TaxID=79078 RepID=A0ABU6ZEN0_9FABA|nr:hypothetical protein [Stylosanthes scabra]
MEFRYLFLLSALSCLGFLGNIVQAIQQPAEVYWQTVWANPMPTPLKGLIQSGSWNWRVPKKSHPNPEFNNLAICLRYTINCPPPASKLIATNKGTFFLEHDLQEGKISQTMLTKPSNEPAFLPDTVAKSIPFSSSKLPEILSYLKIEAKSTDAETIKQTLDVCESPALNGEKRYCASSLESLVKFAISQLGKNIRLVSTEFEKKPQKELHYNSVEGVKKIGDKVVVCHKLSYPYAVFYCHKIDTRAYTVSLVSTSNGIKAKALAVCHTNTTEWNAKHVAFKELNVKPGTVPICHFLPTDTLIWVPN